MITYEEGRYRIRVIDQKFGTNQNGKTCLSFAVRPVAKISANADSDDEELDGESLGDRTIAFYFVSDENAKISVQQLRDLGWKGTTFAELTDGSWSLVGQELTAYCVYKTFARGQTQVTGEQWNFASQTTATQRLQPVEKSAVAALQAKFGSLLKAPASPAKPSPKVPPSDSEAPRGQNLSPEQIQALLARLNAAQVQSQPEGEGIPF